MKDIFDGRAFAGIFRGLAQKYSYQFVLGERYYDKFKKHSVSVGALYALCQILWQGIEKAGILDSAKMRQAVLGNEFHTMMGKVKYDKNREAICVSMASQRWEGNQMTVYPFELTNYKIKLAPPWKERK